jgi:sporulation protein YlmC with PRC-barrel domain
MHCQSRQRNSAVRGGALVSASRQSWFRRTNASPPWLNCLGPHELGPFSLFESELERSDAAGVWPVSGGIPLLLISLQESFMADEMAKITSGSLIAAEKVEGTSVYNLQGEKLGTVDDIMIDKVSGKAIYALMSFGGFLGIGEKYHPLPWSTLKYDESKGGYLVNLDKQMLEGAPNYGMDEDFRWTPDYGRQVDKYYNAPSYW